MDIDNPSEAMIMKPQKFREEIGWRASSARVTVEGILISFNISEYFDMNF